MNSQAKYTKEQHAELGNELYEKVVRPLVEPGNRGRIVAIDVDTGVYEVADDGLTAARNLLQQHPDAQIWCVRIGYPTVHRFGPRSDGILA
jgi:hypothetical protein